MDRWYDDTCHGLPWAEVFTLRNARAARWWRRHGAYRDYSDYQTIGNEAIAKAYASFSPTGGSSIRTWLLLQMDYRMRGLWQESPTVQAVVFVPFDLLFQVPTPVPEGVVSAMPSDEIWDWPVVQAWLARLRPNHRRWVLAHYQDGETMYSITRREGWSPAHVGQALRSAVALLRQAVLHPPDPHEARVFAAFLEQVQHTVSLMALARDTGIPYNTLYFMRRRGTGRMSPKTRARVLVWGKRPHLVGGTHHGATGHSPQGTD